MMLERLEDRSLLATIQGVAFHDLNGNGTHDSGEETLPGITVFLDQNNNEQRDVGESWQQTNGDGEYSFTSLAAGEYVVRQLTPAGQVPTLPLADDSFYAQTYVVGSGAMQVARIDPETGAVERLGIPNSNSSARLHGLVRTNDGQFFGLNGFSNPDTLFKLDLATNAITPVGSIGADVAWGLAYDPTHDTIFGLATDPTNGLLKLASFDRQTGIATLIGPGTNQLTATSGLAFDIARGVVIAYDQADHQFWQFDANGTPTLIWDTAGLDGWGLAHNGRELVLHARLANNGDSAMQGRLFWRIDPYQKVVLPGYFTASEPVPLESLDYYRVEQAHLVFVSDGETASGVNFGSVAPIGTLRGTKFEDGDGDGVRDANEGPLAGVTIYLDLNDNGSLDLGSTPEPTAVTDSNGEYAFADVPVGDYVVREVVPDEYVQTFPAIGAARLFATVATSTSQNLIYELNPLTGAVLNSFPIPGAYSSTTNGLAYDGQTLYVLDSIADTLFEVDPDTGAVRDSMPLGPDRWDGLAVIDGLVYANDPFRNVTVVIDPVSDSIVRTINFGAASNIRPFGGLGEFVDAGGTSWLLGSVGSSNAISFLDPQTGNLAKTITHGSFGSDFGLTGFGGEIYIGFANATAATGAVQVVTESGAQVRAFSVPYGVTALAGGAAGESAHRVTVGPGQTVGGLDFGNRSVRGELHGTKFVDLDADGSRDPGEPAAAGVTIYLDLNGNGALDAEAPLGPEPTAVTGADGSYQFTGLLPGDYVVREVVPGGFEQTTPLIASRLFATNVGATPDAIVELDPQTGAILNVFPAPLDANTTAHGLAFDGKSLFFLDANNDTLIILDPETGAERSRTTLPSGFYDGVAATGGAVYVLDSSRDDVLVLNSISGAIQRVVDLNLLNPGIDFLGGLGEVADRGLLSVTTTTNDVLIVNPTNGSKVGQFDHGISAVDAAATGLGSELFLAFTNISLGIQVFSQTGTPTRMLPTTFPIYGLAGFSHDGSHRVSLGNSKVITGLDFGNRDVRGELHGSKYIDQNGNGARDVGEPPMAGVTVYLDVNRSRHLDAGEPTATTDNDGNYSFTGVMPGEYVVREVVPSGYRQTSPGNAARLFATDSTTTPTTILELNSETGVVLRSFPAPTTSNIPYHGLAFDGSTLYYVDSATRTLVELDPDTGAIRSQSVLPGGLYDGLAVLDGLVYLLDSNADDLRVFDPALDMLVWSLDLNANNPGVDFFGGLGEWEDRGVLLATTATNEVLFIDPKTGASVDRFNHDLSGVDAAITGIGDEIFLGYSIAGANIRVFNEAGVLQRIVAAPLPVHGLAGFGIDESHRVTLAPAQIISGLDFANQDVRGEIRGTKWNDLDGDGSRDQDEPPLGGVTIYLDLNDNGVLDDGEPTSVTGVDGGFAFTGRMPGDYVVREVLAPGFEQTTPGNWQRLFATHVSASPDQIVELDVATGNILASFASPVEASNGGHGLAFDGTTLYYVDMSTDTLYELSPDSGALLHQTQLPPGEYDGIAVLRGQLYISEFSRDDILIFDPTTRTIQGVLDVNGLNLGVNLFGGLGEADNGRSLVATTESNQVVLIDPATGLVTRTIDPGAISPASALASFAATGIGADFFLGFGSTTPGIVVLNSNGVFQRSLPTSFSILGLGGHGEDGSHRISLGATQVINGIDFGNRAINRAPTADAGGPYTVSEGSTVVLDGASSSDPDQNSASLQYLWDLDGDGVYGELGADATRGDEVGAQPTFSATDLDGNSQATVRLRVVDDGGLSSEDLATVVISNVAPTIGRLALEVGTIDEDGTASLTINFSDPGLPDTHQLVVSWGDGSANTVIDLVNGERQRVVTHKYLDDAPSGTSQDSFTIGVTVTDDDGGADTASTSVVVRNVAPGLTDLASNATFATPGSTSVAVQLSGRVSDVGSLDTHSATIAWGDGTQSVATINARALAASHVYSSGGVYAVSVTLRDDDGATVAAATSSVVTGVGVANGRLTVVGRNVADTIALSVSGKGDKQAVRVDASFLSGSGSVSVPFSSVSSLAIWALGGNDQITVASSLKVAAWIDGGGGNDRLTAGGGESILLGGAGDDDLVGGALGDLLIGGDGADTLNGGSGDDILIGGTTVYDNSDMALMRLLDEWTSSRSRANRIANIRAGTGPILLGERLVKGVTVFDDGDLDELNDTKGDDWYFFLAGEDRPTGLKRGDEAN